MPDFRTALLRMLYMIEFLIAWMMIAVVWDEVGGAGHLDLMPWYDKLGLSVGLALVTVMGTKQAVERSKAWNRWTAMCLLLAVAIVTVMGAVTYYYHLQEDQDDDASGDVAGMMHSRPQERETESHQVSSTPVARQRAEKVQASGEIVRAV